MSANTNTSELVKAGATVGLDGEDISQGLLEEIDELERKVEIYEKALEQINIGVNTEDYYIAPTPSQIATQALDEAKQIDNTEGE